MAKGGERLSPRRSHAGVTNIHGLASQRLELASQSPEGAKVQLELVDYRTLAARAADPDATFTQSQMFQRANGWSYHEPKADGELTPTWGSMTCAGITGLAICEAGLFDHPQYKRPKLLGDSRRARDDGFAWLAQWMTARHHAGAIERQQHWLYYYLYSLERAALLSGIALIQDRDSKNALYVLMPMRV